MKNNIPRKAVEQPRTDERRLNKDGGNGLKHEFFEDSLHKTPLMKKKPYRANLSFDVKHKPGLSLPSLMRPELNWFMLPLLRKQMMLYLNLRKKQWQQWNLEMGPSYSLEWRNLPRHLRIWGWEKCWFFIYKNYLKTIEKETKNLFDRFKVNMIKSIKWLQF